MGIDIASDDLRLLEEMFGPGVRAHREGELPLVVLPVVHLAEGCAPASAMAIFVATAYLGYDSRLYFEAPIRLASGTVPATTSAILLGRTMFAASIQGVPATLPPHQAILAHLRRYRLSA